MGRIDFFLGVCLCSLLLPAHAPGSVFSFALQMSTFVLNGSIFSAASNERISQANVALCDEGGAVLQENPSSDAGEFSFQGLRPGRYILRVSAAGYERSELQIDLSSTSQSGLIVSLKREGSAALPLTAGETISAHELAMPEAARGLVNDGTKKLYVEKNPQVALHDFQTAIQQAPTFYEAYYQSGMAYLALQNPGEAEKQFRISSEISQKKYGDADVALGTLLIQRNETAEGESLLRKGLTANPNLWPGQFALGELELSRGHMENALTAARKAAELAPKQAVVYRLLAVIFLRQKDYSALVSALDSYIELDPDSPAGARAKQLRVQAQSQADQLPSTAVAVK